MITDIFCGLCDSDVEDLLDGVEFVELAIGLGPLELMELGLDILTGIFSVLGGGIISY